MKSGRLTGFTRSVVILGHFSIAENLYCGVASYTELATSVLASLRAVYLNQGDWGVVADKQLSSLFVLWLQSFAVSAPVR